MTQTRERLPCKDNIETRNHDLVVLELLSQLKTYFSVVARPRAIPSKSSCRAKARTTRNPRMAETNLILEPRQML